MIAVFMLPLSLFVYPPENAGGSLPSAVQADIWIQKACCRWRKGRIFLFNPAVYDPGQFFRVFRQTAAFEVKGGYLPFQLPDRPAAADAFDFIKSAF